MKVGIGIGISVSNSVSAGSSNPNLIINGDFSDGLTGWNIIRGASAVVTGGVVRITNGAILNSGGIEQQITTNIGDSYIYKADTIDSSLTSLFIRVFSGSSTTGDVILSKVVGLNSSHEFEFIATTTTVYIVVQNVGGSINVDWGEFDNVSVKKKL